MNQPEGSGGEDGMLYFLAIHGDESIWTRNSEEQQALVMKAHEELERELRASGRYRGCAGLATSDTATTVRERDGGFLVSDGPFAEAKEQFGGFYLIDAADLDEAIAVARRIPVTPGGGVEVRPVAIASLVED